MQPMDSSQPYVDSVKHHRDHDGEVEVDSDGEDDPPEHAPLKFHFSLKKLWRFAGPGWLMSLAYLDPGNLEGSLQQGAYTRFALLWVLWWATVMGLILQEMSARLGLVTGRDLAQTVRAHYPRWLCYTIYVMMEIAVIGADIQEVVGSGIAINLITGMPIWAGCLITGIDTFTFLAVQYLGVRYLEALICVLISTMSMCFFINWGQSGADAAALIQGWVVPMMPAYALTQAVGTIGAVIMPHNLYLHSGLVLSRKVKRTSPHKVYAAIWYARIESAVALSSRTSSTSPSSPRTLRPSSRRRAQTTAGPRPVRVHGRRAFNKSGDNKHMFDGQGTPCELSAVAKRGAEGETMGMCGMLGLSSEGYALESALGPSSLYIWALGLLAAGQASTMVCTYAGQIIMGGCLQLQLAPWKRVAFTRFFALGPALFVAVSTGSDTSLFNNINEYLNVLQSVQLPFAMLPVLHFVTNKQLMGRFASSRTTFALTACLAGLVMSINVMLIIDFIPEAFDPDPVPAAVVVIVLLLGAAYFTLCALMVADEFKAIIRYPFVMLGVLPPKHEQMVEEVAPGRLAEARPAVEPHASSLQIRQNIGASDTI